MEKPGFFSLDPRSSVRSVPHQSFQTRALDALQSLQKRRAIIEMNGLALRPLHGLGSEARRRNDRALGGMFAQHGRIEFTYDRLANGAAPLLALRNPMLSSLRHDDDIKITIARCTQTPRRMPQRAVQIDDQLLEVGPRHFDHAIDR